MNQEIIQQLTRMFFAQHNAGVVCNINLDEFDAYNDSPRRVYNDDTFCDYKCDCAEGCHLMTADEIENCEIYSENAEYTEEYPEPLEFWVINNDAFIMLKARGEIVYKHEENNLKLWGRQCTGQAVYLDDVWQEMTLTYIAGLKTDAKHILALIEQL